MHKNTNTDNPVTKPKLVYFQFKYDKNLPPFLLIHKQEQVQCLSEFFDVTVIQNDCDYEHICDTYRPDLALFESGVNHETCQRLKIKNTHTNPGIPKLGFHHADAFCNARTGFISDMEHWGIDTFFALSTTAGEHSPEIADNLFYWPVFVDPSIFRDYDAWKSIPVLLTGNKNAMYPWRQRNFKLLLERFPTLLTPHFGYSPNSWTANQLIGERYARTINASWFVPTCGTIAKEAVRKHFEVPGSKACLVTEKSAALEAAGFIDMQNCLFADENNILDKLDYLFANPEKLNAIINDGYELVHSRHTTKQRNQIYQWLSLFKTIKPHQKIIQLNPFDPPILVDVSTSQSNIHVLSNGLHLELLHEGDEKLLAGKFEEAATCYRKCLNYLGWMPEPKLRLAICNLYLGDPKSALTLIEGTVQYILAQYHAMDPDPVEWAYLIISFLCLGKLKNAIKFANQFPTLKHPELDRTRWVCDFLNDTKNTPIPDDDGNERRKSVHNLQERSSTEWLLQLCIMLKSCGHTEAAERLTSQLLSGSENIKGNLVERKISVINHKTNKYVSRSWVLGKEYVFLTKFRQLGNDLKLTSRRLASSILHRLEAKYGYFLPYHLSEMKNDEFYKLVLELAREEHYESALIIGAFPGNGSTEAFITGAKQNEQNPKVYCLNIANYKGHILKKIAKPENFINWHELSTSKNENTQQIVDNVMNDILKSTPLDSFDVVLIVNQSVNDELSDNSILLTQLSMANLILLDGVNNPNINNIKNILLQDSGYMLESVNSILRNGYAILRKRQ